MTESTLNLSLIEVRDAIASGALTSVAGSSDVLVGR